MIIKYFAHDPGVDLAKEVQNAYLHDSIQGAIIADKEEFSDEEIAHFEYVRVTLEIVKSEEK